MESKNAFIIILLILIISLTIFVIDRCKKNNIEKFEDTIKKYIDETSLTSSDFPDRTIRTTKNDTRPCNIYYVPEKYLYNGETLDMTLACEIPYFNKFKKPADLIQNDLNKINAKTANSLTQTEKDIKKYGPAVIAIKNDSNSVLNKKGKGYCKLDALGINQWVELVNDEYGNIYPKKNLTNPLINAEGPPESSKYCYKAVNPGDNPNANTDQLILNMVNNVADCLDSNPFAQNCAIQGTSRALYNPSPLNDNNKYARIAFKTLNLTDNKINVEKFDTYNTLATDDRTNYPAADPRAAPVLQPCKLGIPLPTGIPGYYFRFILDGSNAVTSFRLMKYNGNGLMVPYPDTAPPPSEPLDLVTREAMEVYKQLFATQTFSSKLYLIPDNFNVEIYKFSYEACDVDRDIGQISYNRELGHRTGLTFSLRDNLKKPDNTPTIVSRSIFTFDSSIDSRYVGNLQQLMQNQERIAKEQKQLEPPIPLTVTPASLGLPAGSKLVNIDQTKLFQGIQYKLYNINRGASFGANSVNADVIRASKLAMDNMFSTGAYKRSGTVTTINFYNSGVAIGEGIGIVFTGYIKIPVTGNYKFLINSDDAGDFTIENVIYKRDNNYWEIPISGLASTYYGIHWVSMEGNIQTQYYFNQNDVVKFTARVINGPGDIGIQLFWVTPDKILSNCGRSSQNPLNPNLPRLPDQYSCFTQIPDSQFFYSIDNYVTENEALLRATHLNDQANKVSKAIDSISSAYNAAVIQNVRNIIGSKLSFTGLPDINDAKSDNYHIYVYIGEFETGSMTIIANDLASSADRDTPILIQSQELEISQLNNRVDTSPVGNLTAPDGNILDVSYTIAFGLNIEKLCNSWRNIIFHGKEDNWSNNMGIDRTPGIWICPNTSQLHVKHHSTKDPNDGINNTNYSFPLGNYAHFTAVVNKETMTIYINGRMSQVYSVDRGHNFIWNTPVGKGFAIHKTLGQSNWTCVNGYIKIKNMLWYNKELTDKEVYDLYVSTGIPDRLPPPSSNQDPGANTIELGVPNTSPWNCSNFIDSNAKWIWNLPMSQASKVVNKDVIFTNYYYADRSMGVTLHIIADNTATVYVNNIRIDSVTGDWSNGGRNAKQMQMTFEQGQNDIRIVAQNSGSSPTASGNPAGLLFTFIKSNDRTVILNSTNRWVSNSSQADVDAFDKAQRDAAAAAAAAAAKAAADAAAAAAAKAAAEAAAAASAAQARAAAESAAAAARITVYTGFNYSGNSYTVERGEYYMTNRGTVGNTNIPDNSIRSVRIPAGNVVDLYQHPGKSGARGRYTTDTPVLPDRIAGDVSDMMVYDARYAPAFVPEPPPPPPPPPPTPVLNPQNSLIKTRLSGNRCLDVLEARQDNGAPLIIWDCHGGGNQRWTYDRNNQTLKASHSGKCIEMNNYSSGPFTYVSQQQCDPNNARQKWVSNNQYQFINQANQNMALNVLGENPNNKTNIIAYDKNQNHANENWFLG